MQTTIEAFQIAEGVLIKSCKKHLNYHLNYFDNDELFYELGPQQYVYLFRYGVLAFYNVSESDQTQFIAKIESYLIQKIQKSSYLSETLNVTTGAEKVFTNFNGITLKEVDADALRVMMLHVSQSVALDHFSGITEKILEDTKKHTTFLELNGSLDIKGKKLKKYIGKVLNIKNKISEYLYIFDTPDIAWEDESLNQLNVAVRKMFDLRDRHASIHQQLNIIQENLDLFKELMFHKESSKLEWIIIILIVLEVLDMIISKIGWF